MAFSLSTPSFRQPRFDNTIRFSLRGSVTHTLFLANALVFAPGVVFATPATASTAGGSSLFKTSAVWDTKTQGQRITALARDSRGRVFVASEENGLWMRDQNGAWTSITPQNSDFGAPFTRARDNNGSHPSVIASIPYQNRFYNETVNINLLQHPLI